MKYIPSTVFKVGMGQPQKGGGSLLQRMQNNKLKSSPDPLFISGQTYKLYSVNRKDNKFEYVFVLNGNIKDKNSIILMFDSTQDGDDKITKLIGG